MADAAPNLVDALLLSSTSVLTSSVSKTSSILVHTSSLSISQCILHSFAELLTGQKHKGEPVYENGPDGKDETVISFTHSLKTASTASGKPVYSPISFHLSFREALDAEASEAIGVNTSRGLGNSGEGGSKPHKASQSLHFTSPPGGRALMPPGALTPLGALKAIPVQVSGSFTLTPQQHGTTQVSLTVTIATSPPSLPTARPPPKLLQLKALANQRTMDNFGVTVATLMTAAASTTTSTAASTAASTASSTAASAAVSTTVSLITSSLTTASLTIASLTTPAKFARIVCDHISTVLPTLHRNFARYAQIDVAILDKFTKEISKAPPPTVHETERMHEARLYGENKVWRRMPNTVKEPIAYFYDGTPSPTITTTTSDPDTFTKAVATVDAPAETILAACVCLQTFAHQQQYLNRESGESRFSTSSSRPSTTSPSPDATNPCSFRLVTHIPNSRTVLYAFHVKQPPRLRALALAPLLRTDRLVTVALVWRALINGTLQLAIHPLNEHQAKLPPTSPHLPAIEAFQAAIARDSYACKAEASVTRGFLTITPLAPSVSRVTYVVQTPLAPLGGRSKLPLTLGLVEELRERYERRGRVVDAEIRDAFKEPPVWESLTPAQTAIITSTMRLESDVDDSRPWKSLQSPVPFVSMWMKYTPPAIGSTRAVALGKAHATIDAGALPTLAIWMAFMNRGNAKKATEEGDPARLMLNDEDCHDNSFATIKAMPFPLQMREFVGRQLCVTEANGDLLLAVVPIDDVVDYGMKTWAVRGTSQCFLRLTSVGDKLCEVTYYTRIDAGGHLPTWVINSKLPLSLSGIGDLREDFQRDDEVDALARAARTGTFNSPQVYEPEEDEMIDRVRGKLGDIKTEDFEEIESPDFRVTMGRIFIPGETSGVGRASVTIDSSAEECAAWETSKLSREGMKEHANSESRDLERDLVKVNEHHARYFAVYALFPGFKPREFLQALMWKREGENIIVVYDTVEHSSVPPNPSHVRGSTTIYWLYEKLPAVGTIPQTRVTYMQQVDLKGSIPKMVVMKSSVSFLMHLSTMRDRFDQSSKIDGAKRRQHIELIEKHGDPYSEAETKLLEEGQQHFRVFNRMKMKNLEMASPLATGKIAFEEGDKRAWGWATTTVRASTDEVLAFIWDTLRRSAHTESYLERSVDEHSNGHNKLIYVKKRMPKIVADREFLGRVVWRKEADGFIFVNAPAESAKRVLRVSSGIRRLLSDGLAELVAKNAKTKHKHEKRVVRGMYYSAMRIKEKSEAETTLEYVVRPDTGGNIPSFVANLFLALSAAKVSEIQEHFQSLRKVEDWDEDDGRAVGEAMCIRTRAEKHHLSDESRVGARLRVLFKKHRGLREVAEKYEFLLPMMVRVVENKLRFMVGDMNTQLCNASRMEGRTVGRGLSAALATNLTAEAGVDDWVLQYRCLVELDLKENWFRPMMNVVGKRLLGEVSWGLKMRAATGAGLSMLDTATDLYVIRKYLNKDDTHVYAWGLTGMVCASLILNLLIVFVQNRKKPRLMTKEMFIVLTFMKPGYDAANVASGKVQEEHQSVDAKVELTLARVIEMFSESIPGCLLQCYAILKSGKYSRSTLGSVIVSALTTGFISATLSFDYDVDPLKRKQYPEFYGYIPDGGSRTVIFACMIMNSALLLLLRSFSAAMLMLVKKRYFLAFAAGDMVLYLLQKALRNDFHYWVPIDGALGLIFDLLARSIVKAVVDFTGVLQFRHPGELGGLYWTMNMFTALAGSFLSVWICYEYGGVTIIGERVAFGLVGAMSGGWLVTFGGILGLMKRKYLVTFFSTQTGKQYIMDSFTLARSDAEKSLIMTNKKSTWRKIESEVLEWVQANWWSWKEEKPGWFDDAFIGKISDSWAPIEDEDVVSSAREHLKRRSRVFSKARRGGRKITTATASVHVT